KHIQDRLKLWGRALQGVEPYRIEFAEEPGLTGLTDFSNHLIKVNPEMIAGLKPREGYEITKAVLCHEAGHRRFTAPAELSWVVHMVANILEDQRIESLIMEEFAGTRPLIRRLTEEMYRQSPELDATDDPGQVVAAALQWRWAVRLGVGLKGELSEVNKERWEQVRPMAEEAWVAATSEEVNTIAWRIVQILGLNETQIPSWVVTALDRCVGHRKRDDTTESKAPAAAKPFDAESDGGEGRPAPFDGEVVPNSKRVGRDYPIEPMPYAELEALAMPMARELIDELTFIPANDEPEPSDRGGSLSVRQYLRERERPFLVRDGERLAPPVMAVRIVIDHSTSMNHATAGRTRIQRAAEAAMMLHLAFTELGTEHGISVMPQQVHLADLTTGEPGKALIAGLVPAKTGYEDLAVAIRARSDELLSVVADIRLLFVLHDGYPNDADKAKSLCQSLKGNVEVIGLLLDPDEGTQSAMREIFGADRLVACASKDLPQKLAAMLEAIRGV
ncbi:MAG TPA: hypothetical protein VNL92_02835, partial [Dehalococcoidia bacterium]|nr:hypothetical protein [Dehalococcoidia bacterium]